LLVEQCGAELRMKRTDVSTYRTRFVVAWAIQLATFVTKLREIERYDCSTYLLQNIIIFVGIYICSMLFIFIFKIKVSDKYLNKHQ